MGAEFWVILLAASGMLFLAASRCFQLRGKRLVTCPATGHPAAVDVKAWRGLLGPKALRLDQCSRWPGHRDCGEKCLKQILDAPEDCLVRNVLARWYRGKTCACCGNRMAEPRWRYHKPCLMSPEMRMVQLEELRAEEIPRILETHKPVCWVCNAAETQTW